MESLSHCRIDLYAADCVGGDGEKVYVFQSAWCAVWKLLLDLRITLNKVQLKNYHASIVW